LFSSRSDRFDITLAEYQPLVYAVCMTVKVICDPNQSIYQFRGRITDELKKFAERFEEHDRLAGSSDTRHSRLGV